MAHALGFLAKHMHARGLAPLLGSGRVGLLQCSTMRLARPWNSGRQQAPSTATTCAQTTDVAPAAAKVRPAHGLLSMGAVSLQRARLSPFSGWTS